jgi:glycosyltransferase involved in cell wall biosynthesis
VDGFTPHPWPSVERTRNFYRRALESEFDLRALDAEPDESFPARADAVLSFHSGRCWELAEHPDAPMLFALHGAAILQQEFLRAHAGILKTSDVLIVNCTSDVTILNGLFGEEKPLLCHLPLPVDQSVFHPRDREECREVVPVEGADYVVGFVGRLLPQRNMHQFLRMLAELKQRFAPRKVVGVVVGNYWIDYPILNYTTGEYPEHIRALVDELGLAEEIVYLPASLSDEELAMCYGAMDILVHPTNALDENFGYVPVEAMACGTPVVAAAYGGVKDTVVSGETGFLMPTWVTRSGIRVDFINGLEHAAALLENVSLRARMSEAAASRARAAYSEEACAERLRAAVRAAVAERRAGNVRPVSLSPPRAAPAPAGLLPPLELPWEYYQNATADYVSAECPTVNTRSRLRLAAPLEAAGGRTFRLLDPAWPALFHLDALDQAVAECCRRVTTPGELPAEARGDLARIQRLVRDGLLLCAV